MDTTILQVPIDKTLRNKAAMIATKMGFSSLQETIRVFLNQLAREEVRIAFEPKVITLSVRNDKRYAKMVKEVKDGKVKTKSFSDINTLIDYLEK